MAIRYRLSLTLINIVFPPLAVLILAGPGYDCLISCVFFLLAVIPSHIHGISTTISLLLFFIPALRTFKLTFSSFFRLLPLLHVLPPPSQSPRGPLAWRPQVPDRIPHHPERRRDRRRGRATVPEGTWTRPFVFFLSFSRGTGDVAAGEE